MILMGKPSSGKTTKRTSTKAKRPGAFQISKEPVVRGKEDVELDDSHKFEITQGEAPLPQASEPPAFEQLGELPQSYGENTLFLIARDPHWLFSYWDIDWSGVPAAATKDGERKIFLKLLTEDGAEEAVIEIHPEAKNWYVPVSKASASYHAELG